MIPQRMALGVIVLFTAMTSWWTTHAHAVHWVHDKCLDTEKKCRHVAQVIHRVWRNDDQAHTAQRVFSCESGLYKWSRHGDSSTQYKGIASLGRSERHTYGFGWRVLIQMRAAHRLFVARGWAPWGAGQDWGCA